MTAGMKESYEQSSNLVNEVPVGKVGRYRERSPQVSDRLCLFLSLIRSGYYLSQGERCLVKGTESQVILSDCEEKALFSFQSKVLRTEPG